MSGQDIKCNVATCRFNSGYHCSLDSITVGCDPTSGRPKDERGTICASFSCK